MLKENDPIFSFNKSLLDSLQELIVAVKINTAFYEANGSNGWITLEKTINYINQNYPELYTIADAKRGDIGNTSDKYAQAFFKTLDFDSITVSPYMGSDSIEPFLKYKDKQTIMLGLTSNKGAEDFQLFPDLENSLFKRVLNKSKNWKNSHNLMYVVGATKLDIYNELFETSHDYRYVMNSAEGGTDGANVNVDATVYIPLRFWFNNNIGLALPLIALQYHAELQIEMKDLLVSYD